MNGAGPTPTTMQPMSAGPSPAASIARAMLTCSFSTWVRESVSTMLMPHDSHGRTVRGVDHQRATISRLHLFLPFIRNLYESTSSVSHHHQAVGVVNREMRAHPTPGRPVPA